MKVRWILHMVMLGVCSVEDIKKKEIALWKIAVYGALICGYEIWALCADYEEAGLWLLHAGAGAIPGIWLLILGRATKEAVGYGDGALTVIIGMSMGLWHTAGILSAAFAALFFTAAIFFIRGRKAKKNRIAFVPFLLLGMAGARLWIKL